jgi:hypothetical protein
MIKNILFIILLLIVFDSCKKYTCPETVYCGTGYDFILVGYDTSELDTVILRVYKGDNSFSYLLDTGVIVDTLERNSIGLVFAWLPLYGNEEDSLLLNELQALGSYRNFDVDTNYISYDWELFIPKDQRTYRITDIKMSGSMEQTVQTCDKQGNQISATCGLYFASYTVDGTVYTYTGFDQKIGSNYIFLTK